jgi:endoglucanase
VIRTRNWAMVVLALCTCAISGCTRESPELGASEVTDEAAQACTESTDRVLWPQTEFYAPAPSSDATAQILALRKAWRLRDAALVASMVRLPHAVWFTGGSPAEVQQAVQKTMKQAARERAVPVLVAYNLPYRDCAQYSSGGATDTEAYEAWIDGFAKGIGKGKAVVIIEPDGLGIIPYNKTINGTEDWCKPVVEDASGTTVPAPGANPEQRYAQLNYAVDAIESAAPHVAAYLDASHSAWLGVGEAAYRLSKAGVARAQGFFQNVSNYQLTSDGIQFGTWVSKALAAASGGPSWAYDEKGNFHYDWLPSQYDPATNYSKVNYTPEFVATVDAALDGFMNGTVATTHFVIDTSRNGQGPLDPAKYGQSPYNQPANVLSGLGSGAWCNPPGAGTGHRPSANTGVALLDAYLWIKVPGESDGSCDMAGGARVWDYQAYNPWNLSADAQNHFDPLWAMVDPSAGTWFREQALELAQKAKPALF